MRSEFEPDAKRRAGVAIVVEHRDYRLADDERDVALDAVAQALDAMPVRVAARSEVNQDVASLDLDRERAHVVRPRIECAAAMQVEARMMPVTSANAVLDAAATERKAHVRASIVDVENLSSCVKHHNEVLADVRGEASFGFEVGKRCGGNPAGDRFN